ncbi:MAG: peptide-methionine (S)-S-oxide reductase [Desulfobacteraceae bacterium]|nr:peptide-methionine (S)-S-oxide reductase [Desulfobacteraceae bacterium]
MESRFGIIEGVISTRVGYAGGSTNAPTYMRIGDHTETVQVDFDPERITYRQLLDILWDSHAYTRQTNIPQYKNAIFYHNEEQRQQAVASKNALEQRTGKTVQTDIVPVQSFTLAEDYHQKYLLKHSALNHFLNTFYEHHIDLIHSTAAARLNGYAGGNGSREQLLREMHLLGLDDAQNKVLEKLVGK